MPEQLQSILLGTAGLSMAALVSLCLSFVRPPVAESSVAKLTRLGLIAVTLHAIHFSEETFTGFHRDFPELLGLTPWPLGFFVIFNLGCLAIWLLSIRVARSHRLALAALWFLAIAAAINFIAHPFLSFMVGGYFPGLYSSPFVGLVGFLLIRALSQATNRKSAIYG